nr:hypothetical protein [Pedobacter panaciterrae]
MKQDFENDEWMKGVRETGFTTPLHYFDELSESINARISAEKFKSVIQNDGHTVPDNYFEKLQANILAKTITEDKQIVKPKVVRLWKSSLVKYASAACFLLVTGIGLYFNKQSPAQQSVTADSTEQMLYDIDEQVIIDHISSNDLAQPKPNAADTDLENYILTNYSQNELTTSL